MKDGRRGLPPCFNTRRSVFGHLLKVESDFDRLQKNLAWKKNGMNDGKIAFCKDIDKVTPKKHVGEDFERP